MERRLRHAILHHLTGFLDAQEGVRKDGQTLVSLHAHVWQLCSMPSQALCCPDHP